MGLGLLVGCADDELAKNKTSNPNKTDFAQIFKGKIPVPAKNDDTIARAEAIALQPDSDFQVAVPQAINGQKILQTIPNRFARDNKVADLLNENGQYIPNPAQEQALAQTRQKLMQDVNRLTDKNSALALQYQIQSATQFGQLQPVKSELRADYEWQNPNEGLKLPGEITKKNPNDIYLPTNNLDRPNTIDPYLTNNAKAVGAQILMGKSPDIFSKNTNINNPKQVLNQSVGVKKIANQARLKVEKPIILLLPLTGPRNQLGKDFRDAALLALSQFAQNTGNPDIAKIYPIDTKGTEEGARQAMQRAIDLGAEIIIGPVFFNEAQAVADMVEGKNILVISFSNTTSAARPNIYPFGYYPEEQIITLLQYLNENKLNRLAVVMPRGEYGSIIYRHIQKLANQYNVNLVKPLEYDDTSNLPKIINQYTNYDDRKKRSIKGLRTIKPEFDAVLLTESNMEKARALIYYFNEVDVTAPAVPLFGLQVLDNFEEIAKEPTAENFNIITADIQGREQFNQLFNQSFKRIADRRATLSFDATSLAIAMNGALNGGKNSNQKISPLDYIKQNERGFIGVDGKILFKDNGWVNREFKIYKITQFGAQLVQ